MSGIDSSRASEICFGYLRLKRRDTKERPKNSVCFCCQSQLLLCCTLFWLHLKFRMSRKRIKKRRKSRISHQALLRLATAFLRVPARSHIDVGFIVIVHGHLGYSITHNDHGFSKYRRYCVILVHTRNSFREEVQTYAIFVFVVTKEVRDQGVVIGVRLPTKDMVNMTVAVSSAGENSDPYPKYSGIVKANTQLLMQRRLASCNTASFSGDGRRDSRLALITRFQHGNR